MSDNLYNQQPSFLDRLRLSGGSDELKYYYRSLIKEDRQKAIDLVNDDNLNYYTLYLLRSDIADSDLLTHLSPRSQKAINLTEAISQKKTATIESLIHSDYLSTYYVLKWILVSGYADDGSENKFDETLELTAALLTKYYRDSFVLALILNMIFSRYRKGFLIHNLVWAFFEARNPQSLYLIANGLLSSEQKDIELTNKLLCFIPCINENKNANNVKQYNSVCQWINENNPYLYYTSESLHYSCMPMPYVVKHEAKYLCKPVSLDAGQPLRAYTEEETELIDHFKKLDPDTRELLSKCSFILNRRNIYKWNAWLRYPLNEQIKFAKMMGV